MSSSSKQPCRQLNSQSIRGAALCYISPIIVGRCSVISAKCMINVRAKSLNKAWRSISHKRDFCDEAVKGIRNVAFFFSAVSTSERNEVSTKEDDLEEESDSEQDELPCTSVSQEHIGRSSVKKYFPAISYWIALTTPNGAPANPIIVHKALLSCGVKVVANQVSCQAHKESLAMKELYRVLKDHKNAFLKNLVDTSYRQSYLDEAHELLDDMSSSDVDVGESENVVKICLVDTSFRPRVARAVSKLLEAKLQVDSIGFETSTQAETEEMEHNVDSSNRMLSDKLTVLINDIEIAMRSLHYSLYRGKVYKKVKDAKYTHHFKCGAREFVNTLAANEYFKARLLRDMKKVCDILSDPYCEVIRPLTVDYNLIEVLHGQCFNIEERLFVENAIPEHLIGKVSPRAFSAFDPTKPADPKYFRGILENSLTDDQIRSFCSDFMKLLEYNKKRHKDKVPCLVGAANSGKTSLFFPLLGIIHHSNIATITKQRSFNKAMIDKFTEIIFVDEASASTMDIDDWKTLTQGGYTAHDVKYQTAKSFINRCPMLITSQSKLHFKKEDQPAMDRRLQVYEFSSLENPVKGAAAWLQAHPMDCIVWAAQNALPRSTMNNPDEDIDELMTYAAQEGVLLENEKEDLRNLCLTDILEEHSEEEEVSTSIDLQEETNTTPDKEENRIEKLERILMDCAEGSLRFRQISSMLNHEKRILRELRQEKRKRQLHRDAFLTARGVSTEEIELLADDPTTTSYPAPIAAKLEEYDHLQREKAKKDREATAQKVFENQWLRKTESKLYDLAQQKSSVQDRSTLAGIEGMIQILQNKLNIHHHKLGTLRMQEALEERRDVLIRLGFLRPSEEHLVDSLTCLPPTQHKDNKENSGIDSDENDDIFITPATSSKPARKRASSQQPRTTRKKKRSLPLSQGNTLDHYFEKSAKSND